MKDTTSTLTMQQFIDKYRISMRALSALENPNMPDMPQGSRHYRCLFRRGGKDMTVVFSMGPAHTSPPTAVDVLNCLANEAVDIENCFSFAEFCEDYGYDEDSRTAERTYNAMVKQTAKLRAFLEYYDTYETLLYHTERE